MNAKPVIKIRRNASSNHYKGSIYRRREIREYKSKGTGHGLKRTITA